MKIKLTNELFIFTNRLFQIFVIMSVHNGEEERPEGNNNKQPHRNPNIRVKVARHMFWKQ
jgi:hypothetical protein